MKRQCVINCTPVSCGVPSATLASPRPPSLQSSQLFPHSHRHIIVLAACSVIRHSSVVRRCVTVYRRTGGQESLHGHENGAPTVKSLVVAIYTWEIIIRSPSTAEGHPSWLCVLYGTAIESAWIARVSGPLEGRADGKSPSRRQHAAAHKTLLLAHPPTDLLHGLQIHGVLLPSIRHSQTRLGRGRSMKRGQAERGGNGPSLAYCEHSMGVERDRARWAAMLMWMRATTSLIWATFSLSSSCCGMLKLRHLVSPVHHRICAE